MEVRVRKALNNRKLIELSKSVKFDINTKVPEKWVMVDLETGDLWEWLSETKRYSRLHKNSWKVRTLKRFLNEKSGMSGIGIRKN